MRYSSAPLAPRVGAGSWPPEDSVALPRSISPSISTPGPPSARSFPECDSRSPVPTPWSAARPSCKDSAEPLRPICTGLRLRPYPLPSPAFYIHRGIHAILGEDKTRLGAIAGTAGAGPDSGGQDGHSCPHRGLSRLGTRQVRQQFRVLVRLLDHVTAGLEGRQDVGRKKAPGQDMSMNSYQ